MPDGRAFPKFSQNTRELAGEKLGSSGLDWDDARELGIYALDDASVLDPSFDPRPCLVFPYFLPGGEPVRSPPGRDYLRVRYLGDPPPGFRTEAKERRYAQPPGSSVAAYFPRTVGWDAVAEDPGYAIVVTEGELKAAAACKAGVSCLALGGVWSWRSAERNMPFLPELESFAWLRRQVYLAFDSDLRRNAKVGQALAAFAEALAERGADPCIVAVPDLPGLEKTGLDDLVVAEGASALWDLLPEAEPVTLSRPLWELNREVCYVRDPGLVVVRSTKQRMAPAAFSGHAYANRAHYVRSVDEEGNVKLKSEKAAKAWLTWAARAECARIEYAPGEPEETGDGGFNMWSGWGCEPKKGSVAPWKKIMDHVLGGMEPEHRRWFDQWLACPLQRPGTKMHTACVFWSPHQGVGKSLVGYTMKRIYGDNFAKIGQADLDRDFSAWAENKQFVLGEEVTATGKRQHADALKDRITQETMRINIKMIPEYDVVDRINYFFTSNSPDAVFMDDGDRRYFVHEVTAPPLPESTYDEYFEWLDGPGASALFAHLLAVDLTGFRPKGRAPMTAAKGRMVEDGRSDLGAWVAALLRDPGAVLKFGEASMDGDLFSARELLAVYDPLERNRVTASGVARELRRQGCPMAAGGEKLQAADGRREVFYVLRGEGWEKPAKCAKHLDWRYGR